MSSAIENRSIRPATPEDASALSSLAFRSKASWGYDIDFMKRCRSELTYLPEQIEAPRFRFRVCDVDGKPGGFYGLELMGESEAELEALFVSPEFLRQGIGTMLIEQLLSDAHTLGIRRITIQGDPNAECFYQSIGAAPAGYRESASIPGRYLPLFTLDIEQE